MIAFARVEALDFRLGRGAWDFAETRAGEIEAHWSKRIAVQPRLFNGRVLVLGPHRFETRAGAATLSGEFLETDFKTFLAWREFGSPASNACNGFAMAALRGADGAFLLGEMSASTANAGAVYFPAGTPDLSDVFGERVDLDAGVLRELREETGLEPAPAEIAPGWEIVTAPGRLACMKPIRLARDAEAARAEIAAWLAAEATPEFAAIHVVRGANDFTPAMPEFVRAYMARAFEADHQTLVT